MNEIFRLVRAFPNKHWCWSSISSRSDISFEYIVLHLNDHPWNWGKLSQNPHIATWKNVKFHPELPWVGRDLADNPMIPLGVILADPVRFDISSHVCPASCMRRPFYRKNATYMIRKLYPEIDWDTSFKSRHAIKLQRWVRHHNQRMRILRHAAIISALRPRLDCSYLINDFLVKWC
jgi:hypothetical protein